MADLAKLDKENQNLIIFVLTKSLLIDELMKHANLTYDELTDYPIEHIINNMTDEQFLQMLDVLDRDRLGVPNIVDRLTKENQ